MACPVPAAAGLLDRFEFVAAAAVGVAIALLATRDHDDPGCLLTLARILVGFGLPLASPGIAVLEATSTRTSLYRPSFAGALAALVWMGAVGVTSTWRTRWRIRTHRTDCLRGTQAGGDDREAAIAVAGDRIEGQFNG